MKNTVRTFSAGLATLTLGASSLHSAIVYEDTFDSDGIGTNAGTGGGLISGTNAGSAADPFDDASGAAVAQTGFGNQVAWAHTTNQFDLSAGFTLDLTFTTPAIDLNNTTFNSFTTSFGIVDEVTASVPTTPGNLNAYLYTDQAGLNTVGFSVANRPTHTSGTEEGIYSDSDAGSLNLLSTALNSAIVYGSTQTFSLTVNADGSGSFSLDSTSGSLPAGSFSSLFSESTDGEYYFVAYSQGNTGLSLSEVAITTIPEPTSVALLGLGGVGLLLRRRK